MARAALDEAFGRIVEMTAAKVAQLGFARRGTVLRTLSQGNSGIIEFQKSIKNSGDKLLFTVNLAVIYGELLEPDQPTLEKARSLDGHLRQRIGMLLPSRPDKWWEITATTDVTALATEISNLVSNKAAPYIRRYLDTSELIALWESGKSPGLTETQRVRHLEAFNSRRKSP
jgi:hypothetical protein